MSAERIPELDWQRFKTLMPRSQDPCLIILKGHLLMEEQIQGIIDNSLRRPEDLKPARLEAFQKIKLAQAILGHRNSFPWNYVLKLNTLRNKFAHRLEPVGLEQAVDSLIVDFYNDEDLDEKSIQSKRERAKHLRSIFAHVCAMLAGFRCEHKAHQLRLEELFKQRLEK